MFQAILKFCTRRDAEVVPGIIWLLKGNVGYANRTITADVTLSA